MIEVFGFATVLMLCTMIALVLRLLFCEIAQRRCYPTRPPLSRERFLALLSPEIPPELGFKVREILVDALGVDEEEIYPDSTMNELIGE